MMTRRFLLFIGGESKKVPLPKWRDSISRFGLTALVDQRKKRERSERRNNEAKYFVPGNSLQGKKFIGDRNIARALFIFKQICLWGVIKTYDTVVPS
ncbi:hypothetical protein CDAR_56891 [Caerostris darwini]|uniref:Uncharacterized protein n=1 Tax=Caerostris darwini TaxID=1538125 RepID=A0AAV4S4V6_9ARAC|nr:hypothetical protein CDAR_56891 [Caerostris darwini]